MGARLVAPLVCLALIATLSSCSDDSKPTSPSIGPTIADSLAVAAADSLGASEYGKMVAWFAERGIALPAKPPAKAEAPLAAVAKPAATDTRLLGDATGNGEVNYWDMWPLWHYLTGFRWMTQQFDFDMLDIDQDGDTDWDDLSYLGKYLYVSGAPNPYRIGEPLGPDPSTSYNIDLVFVEGHGFSASQMALFEEAAERWESIITEDVTDLFTRFNSTTVSWWNEYGSEYWGQIVVNETVDDLRVYVNTADLGEYAGRGGPFWFRTSNWLPVLGGIIVDENELTASNERDGFIMEIMLHELGHTLGFGTGVGKKVPAWEPLQGRPRGGHLLQGVARTVFFQPCGTREELQRT